MVYDTFLFSFYIKEGYINLSNYKIINFDICTCIIGTKCIRICIGNNSNGTISILQTQKQGTKHQGNKATRTHHKH